MRQAIGPERLAAALAGAGIAAAVALAVAVSALGAGPAAAGGAKPRMTAFFQADFTDGAYQQAAYAKVGKVWSSPAQFPKPGRKAVVQSSIGRDGKLLGAVVTMKSGSASWDEAALAAVRKAAPFAPLPAAYKGPQVEVHWHFDTQP
jgi:protein TonB